MDKPFIVSVNSVSGGGKTALSRALYRALPDAALFCFDDFDATNVYPDDFYQWHLRGADPAEFDCPGMAAAVAAAIRQGKSRYIVLDYPLGKDHPRFGGRIDLAVFVDTPLDVAMARRILRDCPADADARERLRQLRREMAHYLKEARYPYLDTCKDRERSDLVLDGWRDLDVLKDEALTAIRLARR